MPEAEQWKLKLISCYEVKCANCGFETSAEGTSQQAIASLKFGGWEKKNNGPWCKECVMVDEMSRDNSEVRPK